MIYLLSTNTVSRFMRGRDTRLRDKVVENLANCRLSAIVMAELEYGAAKRPDMPVFAGRLEKLRAMFAEVSAFDGDAAWHTGRIRAHLGNLKPNARPIGPYDVQIAGHALALGAIVVTHNVDEFRRVPSLSVEDWLGEE
jgi:tRNA(fMet)-specific endonuclease VapC